MTQLGPEVQSTETVARIDSRVAPYDWAFASDEAERIDARWAELRAAKPALFDGKILMARDVSVGGGTLTATAFVTGYKSFLCWREFGFPDADVHNLFAMPALQSAEGHFVLGRMSAGTANAGRLYFPAGTPEPADVGPDGRIDLDGNILRELEEETGLGAPDVALGADWTILFAGPLVACLKIARSHLPAAELREKIGRFIAAQREPELEGLHIVAGPADLDPVGMPAFMVRYLAEAVGRR